MDKRKQYIDELIKKKFEIKELSDEKHTFCGVRGPLNIFQLYAWLLKKPDTIQTQHKNSNTKQREEHVSEKRRIRIVHFILNKTSIEVTGGTLEDVIKSGVFKAAFPLHSDNCFGKNQDWATWTRWALFHFPRLSMIRDYFGEKVALYFAWLRWYTLMLFPAAVVGIIVFLYGFVHFNSSKISQEICAANTTIMCPLCDQSCPYWPLSDTCIYAKITHLFDNEATVFFAMFMALWATVFLEFWKRQRANDVCSWEMYTWDEDEFYPRTKFRTVKEGIEELALELINDPKCTTQEYEHSYLRLTGVLLGVAVMIAILIGIAQALVVYRVVATEAFLRSDWEFLRHHADTAAVMSGAVIHFFTIVVMTKVNRLVATYLCNLEKPRTFTERENCLIYKVFTFQFVTYFSSLFYVAFFLGRIHGYPGNYVRIAGQWRLEECHPSGCITDLFIQMSIIMVLKQIFGTCMEILSPNIRYKLRTMNAPNSKMHRDLNEKDSKILNLWKYDYNLDEVHTFSLFDEFLEMVIQYSFTTIFVAAFPLAPLLAFLNNLLELPLDAYKMTRLQRRLVPRKANDIGIWLQVLEAVGVIAVITNGLVISITSEFIPKLLYQYLYGPCAQGATDVDCLTGYINQSLSTFRTQDFENLTQVSSSLYPNTTECRYRDYRSDDYNFSQQFWHIFAARLAFVILFEHVAVCIKFIADWFVPDVPQSVKNKSLCEKRANLSKELSSFPHSTTVEGLEELGKAERLKT